MMLSTKKNKIVLVNPNLDFQKPLFFGTYPNTAIMVLATILSRAGFEVKVIDGRYYKINVALKLILNEINESLIFIGFSIMTAHVPWAYYICNAIKLRFPNVAIVWGGTHPTLFPEQTTEDSVVDIVVAGDSAGTIAALANCLAKGADLASIPGIFYKKNSKIIKTQANENKDDFNNIPFIDFSLIDHQRYSINNNWARDFYYGKKYKKSRVYPIITALGCIYRCKFCINVILAREHHYREANEIIERIKFLQNNYGANFIQWIDENFFFSKKRIFDFLDRLEKENIRIKWRPLLRPDYFRPDYINLDLAKRLDRLGMVVAHMGVESASQRILDKLDKGYNVDQAIKAAEIVSKTNIIPRMSFMVGIPGETDADVLMTYKMAAKIRKSFKKSCVTVSPYRPYPGSELYNEIVYKYGYTPPSSLKEWAVFSTREFTENSGYESFKGYKWITHSRRLMAMQYVYKKINTYRPGLYYSVRTFLWFLFFDFFYFVVSKINSHKIFFNLKSSRN